MQFEDFIKSVKKVKNERHHKVSNSYGTKDAFHYYRKIRPNDNKYVLTDCQYLKIIRTINNHLRDRLIRGEDVILPERMGTLEIRKSTNKLGFKDGQLVIKYPVNWEATLKLWYDNPQCKAKKQLVRQESSETFRLHYNKNKALYNNKSFYEFTTNRTIKLGLKKNIKLNNLEAFSYGI